REVREYHAGDDVRFIDWNVSARFGHPFTKVFEEERELTVYFLADISGSAFFGTGQKRKTDLIAEICAVLAFTAIKNKDKAGLLFFSNTVEKFIPAAGGREHVLYMVRELITREPASVKTDIAAALRYINRATKHKSIIFILSDFINEGYEQQLKSAAKRHDIIGIKVYDRGEMELPAAGLMQVQDMETGHSAWIDTQSEEVRAQYKRAFFDHLHQAAAIFAQAGADLLHCRDDEDYVRILQQYFLKRLKKH
ncbi:MAG: DUF58 domain-containing protein, partial [Dinghuibacter sp.]|nr:DUF58 domain-containing protein [Dinghuibacter sp.]